MNSFHVDPWAAGGSWASAIASIIHIVFTQIPPELAGRVVRPHGEGSKGCATPAVVARDGKVEGDRARRLARPRTRVIILNPGDAIWSGSRPGESASRA